LMWTINDFPAYGMLSGWSTHGKLACPYCMENNKAFTLANGGTFLHLQHLNLACKILWQQPWMSETIHGSCFWLSFFVFLSTPMSPLELIQSLLTVLSLETKLLSQHEKSLNLVSSIQVTPHLKLLI